MKKAFKFSGKKIGSILLTLCMVFTMLPGAALAAGDIAIDATNFPDTNFRNWLLDSSNLAGIGTDGKLTATEIASVTILNVSNKNIASLAGIEYFTALERLDCSENKLTALDVSNNTALKRLYCNENKLAALNVSNYTDLTHLFCQVNELEGLDVSSNIALTMLNCNSNQLNTLDVSKNTDLTELHCRTNQLTALDVSRNTALTSLNCANNQLTELGAALLG